MLVSEMIHALQPFMFLPLLHLMSLVLVGFRRGDRFDVSVDGILDNTRKVEALLLAPWELGTT